MDTYHSRMDRSRLNIGTYILQPYARTEQHIRELSECGIDFVIGMDCDIPTLDLFYRYNVGAVVGGVVPGWWGGDGDNAGKMESTNPMDRYCSGAEKFTDHPAIWSVDTGDEPSALDFPYYGKIFAKMKELFPKQFPYLNLYPNYASVAVNDSAQTVNQLGTATYDGHIDAYCRNVGADYICYDFYVYSCSVPKMFENLICVANAARRTGRDMWIVLQVNSNKPEQWLSANMLRYQANTAMAFGTRVITWACYTAGWWYNQVLDSEGNKTEQYEKLRQVNREIKTLSSVYDRYENTETDFTGFSGTEWLAGTKIESADVLDTGIFMDVHARDGSALVIGEMRAKSGSGYALFIAAADDPYDTSGKETEIVFSVPSRTVCAYDGSGKLPLYTTGKDCYSVRTRSSQGLIITAD